MSERSTYSGGLSALLSNRKLYAFLIAALLVSIVTVGYVMATSSSVRSESLPVVEVGDKVYVEYVGYFSAHPGGWVFDTNDRMVAMDDSIIKSLYFVERDPTEYTPLNFSAGVSKNLLKPFVDGVVGMTVTQTKLIHIPIEDAYPIVPEYLRTFQINMTTSVEYNITSLEFENQYKLTPAVGMIVEHYFWEWNTTVIDTSGDKVTMQNEPYIGQIISSFGDPEEDSRFGWQQEVISIDPSADGGLGKITVRNMISSQDALQKRGVDFDRRTFTLREVNETSGTFVVILNDEQYVGELAGRMLYFEVTVTKVLKS